MSNILITGASGFVGQYLVEYFRNKGESVVTCSRNSEIGLNFDLSNIKQCMQLKYLGFDKVFHLAAQSSVHVSRAKPWETINYNINSVNNLLETFIGTTTKLIFAGTSEVYKTSNEPLKEDDELDARSVYAISKLSTDMLIRSIGVNAVLLRLFTHTGAGQSTNFALSSWAKQLAEIKFGIRQNYLLVGNLNVYRDYLDVKDVLVAYDLASQLESGIYNICSGKAYSMNDLLQKLIQISGIKCDVLVDKELLRPNDIHFLCGSNKKFCQKTGWTPTISIDETLCNLYYYWLEKIRVGQ